MSQAALNVRNLSVWLETGHGSHKVVDAVSFRIDAGQTHGLVGESGCGKTITAMAIMGLLRSGTARVETDGIEINGRDISALDGARKRAVLGNNIAMIFQRPGTALDPVFTVGQQLGAVYRRHRGGSGKAARGAVLDALGAVGFDAPETTAKTYPHQLSGGMRQLAMIAMAMICRPSVIIADEPTTALDASTRNIILQQLEKLQSVSNTAILLVSHDLSIVRRVCSRVMVMYCGRILEKSGSEALFSGPRHPYSAGLLACIPRISTGKPRPVEAIPGQVPPFSDLPAGCHFAPRCDRAEARCRHSVPRLETADEAQAACFNPLPW
jgi:oligopeptide/dipeptide ABC transporter ATP-binding protein